LGTAFDLSGNDVKALEYYKKGLAIALRRNDIGNVAHLYNNLGTTYGKQHNHTQAMVYLKKALELTSGPRFVESRVSPMMNLANVYAEMKVIHKAMEYYTEALSLARKTGMGMEEAKILHAMGVVQSMEKQELHPALEEAYQLAKRRGNRGQQISILKDLAKIANRAGNYEDEVIFLKEERRLSDSIFNMEKMKEIARLQEKYELNKSRNQVVALKEEGQKGVETRNQIILIACMLGLSVVTLLFLFIRTIMLNRKLSSREKELAKANSIKDRLFSIIGHDLRGPIGNIPALLHIYRQDETTEDAKAFILDSMEENSIASSETLDKLLTWGNMQIKGQTRNPVAVEVDTIMDNKLRLLKVAANNKQISLLNKVPKGLTVFADEHQLNFILRNLIANGIKYTREHGTVETTAGHYAGGFIVFSVSDSGIGIDAARKDRIFDPENKSTPGTANEPGTSIGLMLCKEFVIQNGGKIWVESELGKGSTFHFT
ncbi:MAG: tetratricopeptide repeat protein, partial [Sphingobacteriales bacterium]